MRSPAAFLLFLAVAAAPASGQLASPGKLSRAHADLEGLRSCTRCHELRAPGIEPAKCLGCHTPLRQRIAARRGLHGRMRESDCARCHQEHIGTGADIVRLDTASFRHADTGWPLRGAHAAVGCRECHRAANVTAADVRAYRSTPAFLEKTFLGAASTCAGCHRRESPHEPAINRRACSDCHEERDWKRVERFDHAQTAYPLTGAHVQVACAECHGSGESLKLTGVPHASCSSCHQDPHAGRFGAGCAGCHQTTAWTTVPAARVAERFDHARTRFPLRGAHARAQCGDCHDRTRAQRPGYRIAFTAESKGATYPEPRTGSCGACHVDAHEGQLRAPAGCDRCHGEERWLPVRFDVARHQRESRFPLVGAHLAVPCRECHTRTGRAPAQLRWRDLDCRACHAAKDPHRGMFPGRACGECHRGASFKGAVFDHAQVAAGPCASCHADDDPHGSQFGDRDCGACHETRTYRIASFDHTQTRFPLEGGHERTPCGACHRREPAGMVRYRPLPVTCTGCHGGAR